jgi:hypothetical protein
MEILVGVWYKDFYKYKYMVRQAIFSCTVLPRLDYFGSWLPQLHKTTYGPRRPLSLLIRRSWRRYLCQPQEEWYEPAPPQHEWYKPVSPQHDWHEPTPPQQEWHAPPAPDAWGFAPAAHDYQPGKGLLPNGGMKVLLHSGGSQDLSTMMDHAVGAPAPTILATSFIPSLGEYVLLRPFSIVY